MISWPIFLLTSDKTVEITLFIQTFKSNDSVMLDLHYQSGHIFDISIYKDLQSTQTGTN